MEIYSACRGEVAVNKRKFPEYKMIKIKVDGVVALFLSFFVVRSSYPSL